MDEIKSDPPAATPTGEVKPDPDELLLAESSEYYLFQNGTIYGPADLTRIAGWAGEGRITPRDWLFIPEAGDWVPVIEAPGMSGCFYVAADKPSAPPPNIPMETFMKYYHARQDPAHLGGPHLVEKRQWIRIPLRTAMNFSIVRDIAAVVGERREAYTVNISEGGLAFEWPSPFPKGTTIDIDVDLYLERVRSSAMVAHCTQKGATLFVIGACFRNLLATEQDKIRKFIRSTLHNAARHAPRPD